MKNLKTAILYQYSHLSVVDGIIKPVKEGGYTYSGADIAYTLQKNKIPIITPVESLDPTKI